MNKKKVCPKCKKTKRTRCFIKNKVTGEEMCKMCDKKIGSNKFYIPKENRRKYNTINNFSITEDEKKVLAKKKGWDKVKEECYILKMIKKKVDKEKRNNARDNKIKEEYTKEKNKRFLEGLK